VGSLIRRSTLLQPAAPHLGGLPLRLVEVGGTVITAAVDSSLKVSFGPVAKRGQNLGADFSSQATRIVWIRSFPQQSGMSSRWRTTSTSGLHPAGVAFNCRPDAPADAISSRQPSGSVCWSTSSGEYNNRILPMPARAQCLDRARLRQASRLFEKRAWAVSREDLMTIAAADIRASRVFAARPADQ